jgi:hypothetical protein
MRRPIRGESYEVLITGRELVELQKFTWAMAEAFGLDRRIEAYRGKRPLRLARWDLDCLEDVTALALDDDTEYPGRSGKGFAAIQALHERIRRIRAGAYAALGKRRRPASNEPQGGPGGEHGRGLFPRAGLRVCPRTADRAGRREPGAADFEVRKRQLSPCAARQAPALRGLCFQARGLGISRVVCRERHVVQAGPRARYVNGTSVP